ncbi:MAG: sigma-70 family RNA polymerase sigma factor [Xanthomonadales bacterium]|nr:sigma-70 family RNA polymerase sigma factor [Xanthomonadales bacterium]
MSDLTTTTQLLRDISGGDAAAREALIARYLPRLTRWAHGRLPRRGRDLAETDDLVQITLLRALNRLDEFESRRPGAFLAYLRTILMNALRDEIRRGDRKPLDLSISVSGLQADSSVVENVVGREVLDAYEEALSKMTEEKRLAVMMRLEFDMSYQDIADELERPSADATRMMIVRALGELAEAMKT